MQQRQAETMGRSAKRNRIAASARRLDRVCTSASSSVSLSRYSKCGNPVPHWLKDRLRSCRQWILRLRPRGAEWKLVAAQHIEGVPDWLVRREQFCRRRYKIVATRVLLTIHRLRVDPENAIEEVLAMSTFPTQTAFVRRPHTKLRAQLCRHCAVCS